ncbi:hypothetical protein [Spirosoma sp. KUDC1026]|uniref:hypothetical protein n=1 Tax=Spirosoma sp. KUDC1026 TaxID=2745947 RepID=UPI00159BD4B1|nr:hypothetical protein [Spirosoma sp. KUDC1026]QKZ15231.1 hypothetical protein HU175_22435 [Spirosoma sp. KUDC1026]
MRFVRYIALAVALILWGGGLSTTVSHWLYDIGVVADDYKYGDLYRMSALPQFKEEAVPCPVSHLSSDTSSTHLYIIGDSFTEPQRLSKDDFPVSHYQRAAWEHPQRAQLNPAKRNVLLIETVERHFREHFTHPVNELVIQSDTTRMAPPKVTLYRQLGQEFHRIDVEERLESTLFSGAWAFWFKELKAHLTLDWFNRTTGNVSLSEDKQHVFTNLDTDTSKKLNSSFAPLSDQELNTLVDSVNVTAARYKRLGFDAVYLSIIPNKASILEPDRDAYNHLIERVQQHPNLQVPVVDVYSSYKSASQSPYAQGDTHWNCTGRALWLDRVTDLLHTRPADKQRIL